MAKVRQLLNGVSVEVATRRRICHHNRKEHSIPASTNCLVIRDTASGGRKSYCPACAEDIFARVEGDLAVLRNELQALIMLPRDASVADI